MSMSTSTEAASETNGGTRRRALVVQHKRQTQILGILHMKSILLGYAPIDVVHAEFEALLRSAKESKESQLLGTLRKLHKHLVDHFAQEDKWMQETDFPAAGCHRDEHSRVLASAVQVVEQVQLGRFDIGFGFVDALVDWFPGHADYLDSALAVWMCKRRFGARPVVVHPRTPSETRQDHSSLPAPV